MIKLTGQLTENTKWTTLNRTIIVKKGALQVDEINGSQSWVNYPVFGIEIMIIEFLEKFLNLALLECKNSINK